MYTEEEQAIRLVIKDFENKKSIIKLYFSIL